MSDRNRLEGVWLAAWSHIFGALSPNAHERFSWSDDLRFRTGISILANEIEWPDHWDENQINKIFVDSISSIVEGNLSTKTIEFKEFFSKFSHERAKSQQKPLNTYYYLTRLSINQPNTDYIINIQNNSIVFGPTAHDKFYGTEFEGNYRTVSVRDPSLYCPLYVKIRSKSHTEAADASQRVLYAFMGFLNGITSYYAHNFGSHKSLHRIRPSKYQIIADNKKRLITDVWWYSPYEEDEIFPLKVSEPAIIIAKNSFIIYKNLILKTI